MPPVQFESFFGDAPGVELLVDGAPEDLVVLEEQHAAQAGETTARIDAALEGMKDVVGNSDGTMWTDPAAAIGEHLGNATDADLLELAQSLSAACVGAAAGVDYAADPGLGVNGDDPWAPEGGLGHLLAEMGFEA